MMVRSLVRNKILHKRTGNRSKKNKKDTQTQNIKEKKYEKKESNFEGKFM